MSATNSHRTEEPMKPDTQTPLTRDHLQRLKKDKLITSDNWVETPFAEWLELELYAAQNDRDRFEESNRQAWEANARLGEQLAQARDEALDAAKKFCKDLSDSSYERFPAYAAGAARCAEGIGEMRHAAPAAQAAPSHTATRSEISTQLWAVIDKWTDDHIYAAQGVSIDLLVDVARALDIAPLSAIEPKLICERCGADRYKEDCREKANPTKCPMHGDARGPEKSYWKVIRGADRRGER